VCVCITTNYDAATRGEKYYDNFLTFRKTCLFFYFEEAHKVRELVAKSSDVFTSRSEVFTVAGKNPNP